MSFYYANGRQVFPSSAWTVAASSGGSLASGTYYFSLQGKCRLGLNELLISSAITVSSNGKITITINSDARKNGEDWHYYILGASTSSNASSFVQIASIPALDPTDQVTEESLPITIELTHPEHLKLSQTISSFPTTNLINGMLRGYSSNSVIYELDLNDTTSAVDGDFVLVDSGNRWKSRGSFSTYIASFYGEDGCRQDIESVDTTEAIAINYDPDGSRSTAIKLWLTGDNNIVERGLRLETTFYVGSQNKTQRLDRLAVIKFLGYVNLTSGVLRTTKSDSTPLADIGVDKTFSANSPVLSLDDDLQINEAYAFSIAFRFTRSEWAGLLPEGSNLRILANFSSVAGVYQDLGAFTGNGIFNEGGFRRVVPFTGLAIIALSGSGIVESYSFPLIDPINVSGLAANTENQKIGITGNGDVYLVETSDVPAGSALRAIVSTGSGITNAGSFSGYAAVAANNALIVTVNYPNSIRSDYPDVIAGSTEGKFNATKIILYIQRQSDSQIRKFNNLSVVSGTSQVFTIANWTNGTVISNVPTNSDLEFGLYSPALISFTATSGGDFTAGSYRVAYAFEYTGTQVTKISHNVESGCINEFSCTIEDIFAVRRSWGESIAVDDILDIPKNETFPWQVREIRSQNSLIRFNPTSYALGDGRMAWQPNWVATNAPGRWEILNLTGAVDDSSRYPESLEDEILSCWRFEELNRTRRDRFGSNHLSPNGTVTRVAGKIGFGTYFNGSSYLSVTNTSPSLSISSNSLRWSVFVRPEQVSNSTIFHRTGEYFLEIKDGVFKWNVYSAASTIKAVEDIETLQVDKWYCVSCWYDKTAQKIGLAVNNRGHIEAACTTVYDSSTDSFFVGATSSTAGFYTGTIDLLMVWRRTLTAEENKYLYSNGDGAEVPPSISATAIHKRDVLDVAPAHTQTLVWDSNLNSYVPNYVPYTEALRTYENICLLLLRFEGSNNSTIFSDSSGRGYTPTLIGSPIIKTDKFKFGSSSGYFDGSSYLIYKNFPVNTSSSWQIELQINPELATSDGTLFCIYKDPENPFRVYLEDGKLKAKYGNTTIFTGTTTLSADTWYHVAIARSGGVTRLFLDGAIEASYSTALTLPQGNPNMAIASTGSGANLDCFKGHIDELRIIHNYATYTAAFTPPTSQLPSPTSVWRLLDNNARVNVSLDGDDIGERRKIQFFSSTGIEITAEDDPENEKVDVTFSLGDLAEIIDDRIAALLEAGSNITLSYNDTTGKLTISSQGGGGGGSGGDMFKSVYDADNDGIVDNTEQLGGQPPSYYRDRTNHNGTQLANTISDFAEATDDRVAALLQAGSNITLNYNDTAGTLTITSTGGGGSGVTVKNGNTLIGARPKINFLAGVGVSINAADDSVNDEIDITITASGGGSGAIANTVSHTTALLAPGAIENVSLNLGKSFEILNVASNYPAWTRGYLLVLDRTSDSSRTVSQTAADPDGLICDLKTSSARLSLNLTPRASAYYSSSPGNIPFAIANLDTVARAITITVTKVTYET